MKKGEEKKKGDGRMRMETKIKRFVARTASFSSVACPVPSPNCGDRSSLPSQKSSVSSSIAVGDVEFELLFIGVSPILSRPNDRRISWGLEYAGDK